MKKFKKSPTNKVSAKTQNNRSVKNSKKEAAKKNTGFKSPWKKGEARQSSVSIQIAQKDNKSKKRTLDICDINWIDVSDEEAVALSNVIGDAVIEFFQNLITCR